MSSKKPISFADAETPREAIQQAVGAASVCWTDQVVHEGKYGRPDTTERVFDERQALEVADALIDRLAEFAAAGVLLEEAR